MATLGVTGTRDGASTVADGWLGRDRAGSPAADPGERSDGGSGRPSWPVAASSARGFKPRGARATPCRSVVYRATCLERVISAVSHGFDDRNSGEEVA